MAKHKDLKNYVKKFAGLHCHPAVKSISVSNLYDLFPSEVDDYPDLVSGRWPDDDWPDGDKPGVYVILGKDLTVLYVGATSTWQKIKTRLAAYFRYDKKTKGCVIPKHHNWRTQPRYVATIGFPPEVGYEAMALEQFLIQNLKPKENTIGT